MRSLGEEGETLSTGIVAQEGTLNLMKDQNCSIIAQNGHLLNLPQVHVSPALYLQTSQVKAVRTGPRSQALSSRSEPWALELAPTPPRAGTPAEPSSLKISKDQALISKNLRGSRAPDISLHELPHCPMTSLFLSVDQRVEHGSDSCVEDGKDRSLFLPFQS